VTTAELGLITTAIVGVAAALSPALISWANRRHERAMARSARLYEQRRKAYEDLAVDLERSRLYLADPGRSLGDPTPANADEWATLMAAAAVAGSAEVQAKLAAYHQAEYVFFVEGEAWLEHIRKEEQDVDLVREAHVEHAKSRTKLLQLVDEAERAMQDELAAL
jgi:hypothetical protein